MVKHRLMRLEKAVKQLDLGRCPACMDGNLPFIVMQGMPGEAWERVDDRCGVYDQQGRCRTCGVARGRVTLQGMLEDVQ
jgi:hypothetical protein